jgi:hypothetical protein
MAKIKVEIHRMKWSGKYYDTIYFEREVADDEYWTVIGYIRTWRDVQRDRDFCYFITGKGMKFEVPHLIAYH